MGRTVVAPQFRFHSQGADGLVWQVVSRLAGVVAGLGFRALCCLVRLITAKPLLSLTTALLLRGLCKLQNKQRCVFLNYWPLFNVPILVALNAADTARGLEALSDEEVVADAMQVMTDDGWGIPAVC